MQRYYGMLHDRGEPDAVGKMKQFATYFTHGVRGGSKLRAEIYSKKDSVEILECVERFFMKELEAVPA
jgi:tRNA-dihydrouridine synthase